MKDIRITVMRIAQYPDLMALYENTIEHMCDMHPGDTFIARQGKKPPEFCQSAWDSIAPFAEVLAHGGGNFYDGWMKNPHAAMISCNDGFRPVTFLVETIE